jgi:lipoprotein-anchoring transpeptidase ErfK/SrfK
MFFNKDQALHGVPDSEVADANLSHGCVRMHVADAEWLRYNFVNIGTPVIVKSY